MTLAALAISLIAALTILARVIDQGVIRYFLGNWQAPLGIGIELRIDHINALVVVMIASVALITAVYSFDRVAAETPGRAPQFYTMYLLTVAGLMGITVTGDAFNLYVLLEVASLSGYALVAMGQRRRASVAAFNYIIMGTIGASFYLLGVGYLYIKTGTLNMVGIQQFIAEQQLYDSKTIRVALILILVGVWIKMAFFPLYGWLPNAYTFSPTTSSCLLAPLVTKVSIYVMIRMMLTVFGPVYVFSMLDWGPAIVWLATIAIVVASLMALSQTNLKKMFCYLIIAEVGYMVGGAWLANHDGMVGAIYHIISDGFMTLCLFLGAGILIVKTGQPSIAGLHGVYRRMPLTMAAFTVGALSMIGVPPTCGFFSKYYLIRGGMEAGRWEFVTALLLSSLINAILFFRIIEVAYFNPTVKGAGSHGKGDHDESERCGTDEAPVSMLAPLMIAAASLLVIGLYNREIVAVIEQTLNGYAVVGVGGGS
ncbi:MAG: monovalent cation/H+ antiporter subunit D family protein [Proteobacteria bacterium]|nr:monovalent cation/H+ antiporter subunit D family protein [Pseudomonadota bacterium]